MLRDGNTHVRVALKGETTVPSVSHRKRVISLCFHEMLLAQDKWRIDEFSLWELSLMEKYTSVLYTI